MAEQLCSNPWRNNFVEGKIWDHPTKLSKNDPNWWMGSSCGSNKQWHMCAMMGVVFQCVPWLLRKHKHQYYSGACPSRRLWKGNGSITCAPWDICMCAVTHSHVCSNSYGIINMNTCTTRENTFVEVVMAYSNVWSWILKTWTVTQTEI